MAKKNKLTFAVSKGLAATGIVLVMSGCGSEVISNPVPPDDGCCVNPAPDFGPADTGDAGHDGGDVGDAATADAETEDAEMADAEADAAADDVGMNDAGDTGTD